MRSRVGVSQRSSPPTKKPLVANQVTPVVNDAVLLVSVTIGLMVPSSATIVPSSDVVSRCQVRPRNSP